MIQQLLDLSAVAASLSAIGLVLSVRWRRPRVHLRMIVLDEPQLDDQSLAAIIAGWDLADPRWVAVQQLLAEEIENATSQVSAPEIAADHGALAHCAGGLEWLRYFRSLLLELKSGKQRRAFHPARGPSAPSADARTPHSPDGD